MFTTHGRGRKRGTSCILCNAQNNAPFLMYVNMQEGDWKENLLKKFKAADDLGYTSDEEKHRLSLSEKTNYDEIDKTLVSKVSLPRILYIII
jgi:hypothetical protein